MSTSDQGLVYVGTWISTRTRILCFANWKVERTLVRLLVVLSLRICNWILWLVSKPEFHKYSTTFQGRVVSSVPQRIRGQHTQSIILFAQSSCCVNDPCSCGWVLVPDEKKKRSQIRRGEDSIDVNWILFRVLYPEGYGGGGWRIVSRRRRITSPQRKSVVWFKCGFLERQRQAIVETLLLREEREGGLFRHSSASVVAGGTIAPKFPPWSKAQHTHVVRCLGKVVCSLCLQGEGIQLSKLNICKLRTMIRTGSFWRFCLDKCPAPNVWQ